MYDWIILFLVWLVGYENSLVVAIRPPNFFEETSIFSATHPSRYLMTEPIWVALCRHIKSVPFLQESCGSCRICYKRPCLMNFAEPLNSGAFMCSFSCLHASSAPPQLQRLISLNSKTPPTFYFSFEKVLGFFSIHIRNLQQVLHSTIPS